MATLRTSANRYAKALFDVALQEKADLAKINQDLADVAEVMATNRDLIADVKAGRFREDLFYRLHVFPISVPPLRTRRDDIPELARHFLTRIAAEEGKRIRSISAHGLALLAAYNWPGNVRQLENAIFRAVVLADGDEIGAEELALVDADDLGIGQHLREQFP